MKIQKCKITGAQVFVFMMSNLDRKTHRALRGISFAQSLYSTLVGFGWYCQAILLQLPDRVYPTCRTCARDRGLKTMANGQGWKLMDCHALLLPCVAQPWYDGTLPHSNQCNQCAFGGFVDNGRWPEGGS